MHPATSDKIKGHDPDYLAEKVALFTRTSAKASAVSKSIAGRFVSEQKGWAQWIHLRLCIAAHSLLTLADYQVRIDAGEECTLDQSSIASLARGMMEAAAMLAYISDETLTDEQWNLRKQVLWLHDATTRYKMFSNWKNEEQTKGLRQSMEEIKTRISVFAEFQSLTPDRQKRIMAGSEMYLHGLRGAIRLMDWDAADFDATYGYLSSHSHSAPVSFIRLGDHGVDFKKPTRAQQDIASFAMEVANNVLAFSTGRIASLFGVEVPLD
jgi:Family of unknown function (DUF5677)